MMAAAGSPADFIPPLRTGLGHPHSTELAPRGMRSQQASATLSLQVDSLRPIGSRGHKSVIPKPLDDAGEGSRLTHS